MQGGDRHLLIYYFSCCSPSPHTNRPVSRNGAVQGPGLCPAPACCPARPPRAKALLAPWGTSMSPARCRGSHTTIAMSLKPREGTAVSLLAGMLLHPPKPSPSCSRHQRKPDTGARSPGKEKRDHLCQFIPSPDSIDTCL